MNTNLYWVGLRKSEINSVNNFFKDSIILFGKKEMNTIPSLNYSLKRNLNHNDAKNDEIIANYQKQQIKNILSNDPNAKFMFYNQIMALHYFSNYPNIICLNSKDLINKLEDKLYTREYYKKIVPSLPHIILDGSDISISNLQSFFKTNNLFIIQAKKGSGGSGTLLYSNDLQKELINKDDKYLITEYCKESISINTHLMISKNEVYILPGSIQIIENQLNHLSYKGCDFIGFQKIKKELQQKAYTYSKIIGQDLQSNGYLGICGIDFLIYNNEVYFMEINSRFQNSSTILNKSLQDNNLLSLQEMNYMCFNNIKFNFKPISVNYSSYIVDYDEESLIPDLFPIKILDEADINLKYDKPSYLKTMVYNKTIYNGEQYGIMEN